MIRINDSRTSVDPPAPEQHLTNLDLQHGLVRGGWLAGLTANERGVLWVLLDFRNAKTGLAWPSVPRMAKLLGTTEKRVRGALRSLEMREIINTHEAGGGSRRGSGIPTRYSFSNPYSISDAGAAETPLQNLPSEDIVPLEGEGQNDPSTLPTVTSNPPQNDPSTLPKMTGGKEKGKGNRKENEQKGSGDFVSFAAGCRQLAREDAAASSTESTVERPGPVDVESYPNFNLLRAEFANLMSEEGWRELLRRWVADGSDDDETKRAAYRHVLAMPDSTRKAWKQFLEHRRTTGRPLDRMQQHTYLAQLEPFEPSWVEHRLLEVVRKGWKDVLYANDDPPRRRPRKVPGAVKYHS